MKFKDKIVPLSTPRVMGILNVTPDSFSDGGQHINRQSAIDAAHRMAEQGADFIDIGGESTRPGAKDVAEQEELDRVIPIVEALSTDLDAVISVDTSKARVMHEAVNAGASLINDVRALQEPQALKTAAQLGVPVCLMHMQGQPRSMQQSPHYDNVVKDVCDFLLSRVKACHDAGVKEERIILDPGFGFGKQLEHNYQLLKHLPRVAALGYPLLVGMSRKSMIGQLLHRPVDKRLAGSVAVATIAAHLGANIIRVHDVEETADAVSIVKYINALQE